MDRIDSKEKNNQWNYLHDVYNELVEDIERTRYENKNLSERIIFYQTILQNIPALFVIINLNDETVVWKNKEFENLINTSSLDEKDIIGQINRFYQNPDPLTKGSTKGRHNHSSNNGIFKTINNNGEETSYYFKGHNLKYDKKNDPEEVFITAFNLTEKINTEHQLEELIKENKRLKNKLAVSLLSNREKEIVKLISEGMSSRKISEDLGLSFYTIETHRKNILRKLDLNNSAELIRFSTEAGLV
jgi:DNA-binding CsgD family transcriptional regulator